MGLRPLAKLKEKKKETDDEPDTEEEPEEEVEEEQGEKPVETKKESTNEVLVVDAEQIPQQEIRVVPTKKGECELLTPNEALGEILSGIRKIVTEMEQ